MRDVGDWSPTDRRILLLVVIQQLSEAMFLPPKSSGAADVCIHGDAPLGQEPFWDIAPIPVLLAPGAKLG